MLSKGQSESDQWITNAEIVVTIVIQLLILAIAAGALAGRQWLTAFSGAVVLLLSFAPSALERHLRVQLPVEVSLFTCLFLFATFVLGELRDFYERVWWWDLAMHGTSAFVLGLIGFLMVYVFYMTHRVKIEPIYVACISFGAAVTVGTMWEIFEFLMDQSFGLQMQRSGLVDTMTDQIVNAVGALVAAIIGYRYVKHGDAMWGHRVIRNLAQRLSRTPSKRSKRSL